MCSMSGMLGGRGNLETRRERGREGEREGERRRREGEREREETRACTSPADYVS